ncbi:hypothetical protein WJX79_005749 [Trebouxia sp. C0005]
MPVSTSEIFSFQVAVGLSLKQNTPLKDEFSYLQVIRKYAEPGYSRSTNEGVTTSHDWQFLHILRSQSSSRFYRLLAREGRSS